MAGLSAFISRVSSVRSASRQDTSGGPIVLADASSIGYASEGGSFSLSREALIEQDSAPTGASDTPTAAAATFISTFQEELTAFKIVFYADWALMRAEL